MDLKAILGDLLASSISKLAFPKPGMIVEFDSEYKVAKVEASAGRGKQMAIYELPWVLDTAGVYAPDPDVGTSVMLGFIGGNIDRPFILCAYDPFWKDNYRHSLVRDPATYSTRIDKTFL